MVYQTPLVEAETERLRFKKIMIVKLDSVQETARNIMTFWFKPEHPVHYLPGQFTQIHLPHADMDDRGDKRWFTLSSSPTDKLLSITTKFSKLNPSSFKKTLLELKPGATLNLAEPMGDFVLPKDKTIPLLFIAAGMGITPMHSMIKFLSDTREQRNVHLVYGVKHTDELAWRELFEASNITFTTMVSRGAASRKTSTRSLSAEQIAGWAVADKGQLVYLSGPELMIEQFASKLPGLGVSEDRLITDYFPGYSWV